MTTRRAMFRATLSVAREGPVLVVSRPGAKNALSVVKVRELRQPVQLAHAEAGIRTDVGLGGSTLCPRRTQGHGAHKAESAGEGSRMASATRVIEPQRRAGHTKLRPHQRQGLRCWWKRDRRSYRVGPL